MESQTLKMCDTKEGGHPESWMGKGVGEDRLAFSLPIAPHIASLGSFLDLFQELMESWHFPAIFEEIGTCHKLLDRSVFFVGFALC